MAKKGYILEDSADENGMILTRQNGEWKGGFTLAENYPSLSGSSPIATYHVPQGIVTIGASTNAGTDTIRAMKWYNDCGNVTADEIACEVSTLNASSVFRIGIYSTGDDGYPDTLLVDSGEISGGSSGVKTATISQALTFGKNYWFAFLQGTAAASMRSISTAMRKGFPTSSFSSGAILISVAQSYGALPSSFPASAAWDTTNNRMPVIGVAFG